MKETLYWVWLTSALKFSSRAVALALRKFTPELAYRADGTELEGAGLDGKTVERLSDKSLERAESIIAACEKKNIKIIHANSPDYPRALDRLDDKPYVIYVRGDMGCLRGKKTAAFVGTRKMTEAGKRHAESIANRLVDEGYLLVSGLAGGVDSVAARVSLERGVPTVAVLGVDIDKYFPKINEALTDRVAETGAVISEYPPKTNSRYFATRNRIITGLSDIFNVVEAGEGSGALIGGKLALKKKIPTFALCLEGKNFDGCRQLVALGAKPIEGSTDLSDAPKPVKKADKTPTKKAIPEDITGTRRYIWERLLEGAQSDNSLVDTAHPINEVLCALTELELDGYIKALPGGKYELK